MSVKLKDAIRGSSRAKVKSLRFYHFKPRSSLKNEVHLIYLFKYSDCIWQLFYAVQVWELRFNLKTLENDRTHRGRLWVCVLTLRAFSNPVILQWTAIRIDRIIFPEPWKIPLWGVCEAAVQHGAANTANIPLLLFCTQVMYVSWFTRGETCKDFFSWFNFNNF